jgi:hypothetical protein
MTSPQLIAWDIHGDAAYPLTTAPVARQWMDETAQRFAYRCLPLVIANQAGWMIRCPFGFTAKWNGNVDQKAIRLWYHERKKDARVSSHFGYGVLTFSVPYLFETPAGVNLWVKGPTNVIKDAIQPLEGVVESDWTEASFTMNWKFTRKDTAVRFEKGDPFCMIVPVKRGLAESLDPQVQPLAANPERLDRYQRWKSSRTAFNERLASNDAAAVKQGWQRNYMQGKDVDGNPHADHQTRLTLQQFRHVQDDPND